MPPEEVKGLIEAFRGKYVDVANYLQNCKDAVTDPGYLQNPWGRYRYFPVSQDDGVIAGFQREALNFNIQATVADTLTAALINFYYYRKIRPEIEFKLCLSNHDAIITMCPAKHVKVMCEEVIPFCMCEACEVPEIGLKYTLGEFDISTRWGEHTAPEELLALGVDRKYCGFKEKK